MSKWEWADFSYLGSEDKMWARRAAFLLYDFVNLFDIDEFKIVNSTGETTNQRIEVVYKKPDWFDDEEIDDVWHNYLQEIAETHKLSEAHHKFYKPTQPEDKIKEVSGE